MNPVDQKLALAEHLMNTGALQRASDTLDQVAADAMELPAFWWLRARVASLADDEDAAIRAARAGLARFPNEVDLLVILGRSLHERNQLAEAEEALLSALSVDPEDIDALCSYARVMAAAGQQDKARRLLDRAAELRPESGEILASRYYVAHLGGDDAETTRVAEALARVSEGNPHALAVLGIEAVKRGELGASKALLSRAAQGDVRVVDAVGAQTYREVGLWTHPLLWPLWPVHRFGPAVVWIAAIGSLAGLRLAGLDVYAGILAIVWLVWVLYTWIAPPIVRRVVFGARR